MSSVLNPLGPQPPSVYWRRRLLVALAFIVALTLFWSMFLSGGSGDQRTPVAATSPTATAQPTPTNTPVASTSASTSSGDCADADISVTAQPASPKAAIGAPITFKMLITNTSAVPCTRNVGPKVNTIAVASGGVHVWSSDDCGALGGDQIETIPPGGSWAVQATWNQKLTQPGCAGTQAAAAAGSYDVTGKNSAVISKPTTFQIS
jgi:hypothetical protein